MQKKKRPPRNTAGATEGVITLPSQLLGKPPSLLREGAKQSFHKQKRKRVLFCPLAAGRPTVAYQPKRQLTVNRRQQWPTVCLDLQWMELHLRGCG